MCAPKLENVGKEFRAQPTKTCILIRLWAQHTNHCEQRSLPSLVSLSTTKSSFSTTQLSQPTIMDQGDTFGGFKIDKLTASNYHTWKQKIELVLPSVSSMKLFSMSNRPIFCRMPPPSPSSGKGCQGQGRHRTHSQR
jgi:hypothetical protein